MLVEFVGDILEHVWPMEVSPSYLFSNIDLGHLFEENKKVYRLLYRDPWKVKIVRWNKWTRLWWGGIINGNGSKTTN